MRVSHWLFESFSVACPETRGTSLCVPLNWLSSSFFFLVKLFLLFIFHLHCYASSSRRPAFCHPSFFPLLHRFTAMRGFISTSPVSWNCWPTDNSPPCFSASLPVQRGLMGCCVLDCWMNSSICLPLSASRLPFRVISKPKSVSPSIGPLATRISPPPCLKCPFHKPPYHFLFNSRFNVTFQ